MNDKVIEKIKLTNLAKAIHNLELYNKGLVDESDMSFFTKTLNYCNTKPLMLPSKREGNILALALELNLYKSALYLIDNAYTYNIDVETIAKDNEKTYSTKDELEYSTDTMNDYLRLGDVFMQPMLEMNIKAFEQLCKIYNIEHKSRQ